MFFCPKVRPRLGSSLQSQVDLLVCAGAYRHVSGYTTAEWVTQSDDSDFDDSDFGDCREVVCCFLHESLHFPADLTWHLTNSRLPPRAHEKSIEPLTRQTCKKHHSLLNTQCFGVVLSCRFAESKVRWTSPVLWMAVKNQSNIKSAE
eukprot:scpid102420/ scgid30380/ 